MNGYVEAGYAVVFGSLGAYGLTLLGRERAVRRRVLGSVAAEPGVPGSTVEPRPTALVTQETEPASGAAS